MAHHTVAFVEFVPVVDLTLIAGAGLAIMALLALYLILGAVQAFFEHLPWPLNSVAGLAADAMRWARNSVSWVFDNALHALSWSVHALVRFWEDLYNELRTLSYDLEKAARWLKNHDIPRLNHQLRNRINQADRFTRNWAANLVASVRLQLTRMIHAEAHRAESAEKSIRQAVDRDVKSLSHRLTALSASLRAEIARVQHSLRAEISDVSQRLTAMIVSKFLAAEQLTRQMFTQAEKDIQTAKQQSNAYTDTVAARTLGEAISEVDREAHRAEQGVWPEVTAMVGTLEKTAGNDFPELTRLLQQIPTNVPADLAAAIAASVRFMPPVLRTMDECVIPQCRDLGPTRQALHDLQLPITSVALIAWFIQMITDPDAWANETYDVMRPLVNAEYGVLSGLLGI